HFDFASDFSKQTLPLKVFANPKKIPQTRQKECRRRKEEKFNADKE
ncbi:hypothetical protein NPIL_125871, partial [Nephila pilipes]